MMIVYIKQKRYTQNIVLIICAFASLHGVTEGTGDRGRVSMRARVSQAICISTAKYSTSNTIQGPHKDPSMFQASKKAKCEIIKWNKCGSRAGCQSFECPAVSTRKGTRIVGGMDALPHEFPYQIQIYVYGHHHCGGVLLNERYFISSALCFRYKNNDTTDYFVIAGVHNKSEKSGTEQERNITTLIAHEDYNQDKGVRNNIIVGKVDPPFELTAAVQPVLMPPRDFEATGNATVTGWGSLGLDSNIDVDTDILQKLTIPIITNQQCSDRYHQKILTTELCAGYIGISGISPCTGDQGGPLVLKIANGSYVLIGISSWDSGCPDATHPSVYTRVTEYLGWIYRKAGVNIS